MWIALGIIVFVLLAGILIYNGLVRLNVRVDEAWSDITVQLKRRADLIPNLINTVKGYAAHEKTVFENVTAARSAMLNVKGPAEAGKVENQFQQTMKSLVAVAEAYPDLKANENFKSLQAELTDTEDKIQAARRFYNGSARDLNTKIKTIPTSILANMLGFKIREFFGVDETEAAKISNPTDVKF